MTGTPQVDPNPRPAARTVAGSDGLADRLETVRVPDSAAAQPGSCRLVVAAGLAAGPVLAVLGNRVWLPGPLGVAGIGLVVGYLRAVGRLVPTLLRLLPTLLARNLLHTRRSRVVYADTRVLIQRRLVVAALVVRH